MSENRGCVLPELLLSSGAITRSASCGANCGLTVRLNVAEGLLDVRISGTRSSEELTEGAEELVGTEQLCGLLH